MDQNIHSKLANTHLMNYLAIAGKQAVHPNPVAEENLKNMPDTKLGRYLIAIHQFIVANVYQEQEILK